jgi:hypothetical protein
MGPLSTGPLRSSLYADALAASLVPPESCRACCSCATLPAKTGRRCETSHALLARMITLSDAINTNRLWLATRSTSAIPRPADYGAAGAKDGGSVPARDSCSAASRVDGLLETNEFRTGTNTLSQPSPSGDLWTALAPLRPKTLRIPLSQLSQLGLRTECHKRQRAQR